jgi:hypothetical protein
MVLALIGLLNELPRGHTVPRKHSSAVAGIPRVGSKLFQSHRAERSGITYAPLGKFYDLSGNEAGGLIVPHSQAQVFAYAFKGNRHHPDGLGRKSRPSKERTNRRGSRSSIGAKPADAR